MSMSGLTNLISRSW